MILWKGTLAPTEWWMARTLEELIEIEEAFDAKKEESRDNPETPHPVPSGGEATDGSDREGHEVRALCPDDDPEVEETPDEWILKVTPLPS